VKDDHVLTDGSPPDDLIFALIIGMNKDHKVWGGTTMFYKDGSPSGNHGIG
jgi:hypothetical protein